MNTIDCFITRPKHPINRYKISQLSQERPPRYAASPPRAALLAEAAMRALVHVRVRDVGARLPHLPQRALAAVLQQARDGPHLHHTT